MTLASKSTAPRASTAFSRNKRSRPMRASPARQAPTNRARDLVTASTATVANSTTSPSRLTRKKPASHVLQGATAQIVARRQRLSAQRVSTKTRRRTWRASNVELADTTTRREVQTKRHALSVLSTTKTTRRPPSVKERKLFQRAK